MLARETTCCFTGHREKKLPWGSMESDERCVSLKKKIYDAVDSVYASGIRHYICGMASGCDMFFGEAVLELKLEHPDITLEAAIPYARQASSWRSDLKERYQALIDAADYHTLVREEYTHDCMHKRNQYMVDNSSVLIAAYNGERGGTMMTMLYAMRQKIEIIEISL